MVAADSTNIDISIRSVPLVDRQQNKTFENAPGIGNRIHQAIVDHIPPLRIILFFLLQYSKYRGSAFSYSIFSKFSVQIRLGNISTVACNFDQQSDLIDHIFVIIDRKSTRLNSSHVAISYV